MSYDITIAQQCPHCGHTDSFEWDPTYNLREMFVEAFGGNGVRDFDGKKGSEVLPVLERALVDMRARPDHYRKLDSPNGWGTFDSDIPEVSVPACVERFAEACRRMPDALVKV